MDLHWIFGNHSPPSPLAELDDDGLLLHLATLVNKPGLLGHSYPAISQVLNCLRARLDADSEGHAGFNIVTDALAPLSAEDLQSFQMVQGALQKCLAEIWDKHQNPWRKYKVNGAHPL